MERKKVAIRDIGIVKVGPVVQSMEQGILSHFTVVFSRLLVSVSYHLHKS